MQVNADIASQLSSIVSGASQPSSTPRARTTSNAPAPISAQVQELHQARQQGQEQAYLEQEVKAISEQFHDLDIPLNFSVEVSERGDYFIRVLDEAGKEVKVIPSEKFVETRDRIHTEIKGLIEDSQS